MVGSGGGLVAQSCLTLVISWAVVHDSSVHGVFQAKMLEWFAISFCRGLPEPGSPALQADSLPTEQPGSQY